jgi:hypothetical protein
MRLHHAAGVPCKRCRQPVAPAEARLCRLALSGTVLCDACRRYLKRSGELAELRTTKGQTR